MSTKAGEGNNHRFILAPETDASNTTKIKAWQDYVRVDAVTWYVNQQGNFFTDRMVAGTLEYAVNGLVYSTVLGSYRLEDDQKTAPIFDQPIVPWIAYQGGPLMLRAFIRGTEENTAAGALLKQMASATLTVVAGAITAETGGLATMALAAAGSTLTNGAISMLNSNTKKTTPIFDPFQVTVDLPTEFAGNERYVLLHRGADEVKGSELSVIIDPSSGVEIQRDGEFFDDGAWILFRIKKTSMYEGDPRPWEKDAEAVKSSIEQLIQLWEAGAMDKESVATSLVPTGKEPNVGDKYIFICSRIREDLVLTRKDRTLKVGDIRTYYEAAKIAVEAVSPLKFYELINKSNESIRLGAAPPDRIASIYLEEAASLLAQNSGLEAVTIKESDFWKTLASPLPSVQQP